MCNRIGPYKSEVPELGHRALSRLVSEIKRYFCSTDSRAPNRKLGKGSRESNIQVGMIFQAMVEHHWVLPSEQFFELRFNRASG